MARTVRGPEIEVGMDASSVKEEIRRLRDDFNRLERQVTGTFARTSGKIRGSFDGVRGTLVDIERLMISAFAGAAVQRIASKIYTLNSQFMAVENTMLTLTGNSRDAAQEMDYVRMEAERLGMDFFQLSDAYSKLSIAGRSAGFEQDKIREIFESTAEAGRVLNFSAEQIDRTFRALYQIMSKGKVNAEEIRQQFSEHIPGGFQIAERAIGKYGEELDKMMRKGEVTLPMLFNRFAEEMRNVYGVAVPAAISTSTAEFGRLRSELQFLGRDIGKGLEPMYIELAKLGQVGVQIFTDMVTPEAFAKNVREAVATALEIMAEVVEFTENNPMVLEGGALGFLLLGGRGSFVRRVLVGGAVGGMVGKLYDVLFGESPQAQIKRARFELEHYESTLAKLEVTAVDLSAKLAKAQDQKANQKFQWGVSGIDVDIANFQKKYNEVNKQIAELEPKIEADRELIANLEKEIATLGAGEGSAMNQVAESMRETAQKIRNAKTELNNIQGEGITGRPQDNFPKELESIGKVKDFSKTLQLAKSDLEVLRATAKPTLGEVQWTFQDMVANVLQDGNALVTFQSSLTQSFVDMARGVKGSFSDMVDGIIEELMRLVIQYYVTKPIIDGIGQALGISVSGGYGGYGSTPAPEFYGYNIATSDKGRVLAPGEYTWAGENGPEIVKGPGTVVSRKDSERYLKGGSSGNTMINNIKVITPPGMEAEVTEQENGNGGIDTAVIIRQIENGIATNVSSRRGPLFKALQQGGFKGNLSG